MTILGHVLPTHNTSYTTHLPLLPQPDTEGSK